MVCVFNTWIACASYACKQLLQQLMLRSSIPTQSSCTRTLSIPPQRFLIHIFNHRSRRDRRLYSETLRSALPQRLNLKQAVQLSAACSCCNRPTTDGVILSSLNDTLFAKSISMFVIHDACREWLRAERIQVVFANARILVKSTSISARRVYNYFILIVGHNGSTFRLTWRFFHCPLAAVENWV